MEEHSAYNLRRIARYSLAGYQDIDFNDHSSLRQSFEDGTHKKNLSLTAE